MFPLQITTFQMSAQRIRELESTQDRLDQKSLELIREQSRRLRGVQKSLDDTQAELARSTARAETSEAVSQHLGRQLNDALREKAASDGRALQASSELAFYR